MGIFSQFIDGLRNSASTIRPLVSNGSGGTGLLTAVNYATLQFGATGNLGTTKNNITSGPPGVNDDSTQGYSVFSEWIDTTGGAVYKCQNSLPGAAVWVVTSATGDMLVSVYDPTAVGGDAFSMGNMVETSTKKILTDTERTKLSGIATGATANDTDANLKNRANHTGSQAISTVTDLQSSLDALYPVAPITTLAITDMTLALTDANRRVEINKATAVNVTVPPNSSVAFSNGTRIPIYQRGAGAVTIVAGAGVTLRYPTGASLTLKGQYSVVWVEKTTVSDTWVVYGDLAGMWADTSTAQSLTNKTLDNTNVLNGCKQTVEENAQTGTTYTTVLTDASKLVSLNNASAVTLTVPPNSSVAYATGTQILLYQKGAGQVTVSPGSGVTINARGAANKLYGQHSTATLIKVATDTWVLSGDITT